MKWYFACNENSSHFFPLIDAAVNSALKNTTLKPYFIFDGEECEFTEKLRDKGVEIIFHRVSFYDALKNYYDQNGLKIASGAFLRCDIPIIEKEDEFVLYTDCDVVFLKDFECDLKPKYFACAPQTDRNNFSHFNTGVMLMNVAVLRQTHEEFCGFIKKNLSNLPAFDQCAYQIFYSKNNTKLPTIYNHKPYWDIDDNAVILHFHGAKPISFADENALKNMQHNLYSLYKMCPNGYDFYLGIFKKYSGIEYDYSAIEKLKNGIYPCVQNPKSRLITRLKNRLNKMKVTIVNKFINRAIFK